MDAPTIQALTTVAGAALLTGVLVQYIALPLLNLSPETRDRLGPIVAIVVGIIVVEVATFTVLTPTRVDVVQGAVNGIFAGLAAIGIHSVAQNTLAIE